MPDVRQAKEITSKEEIEYFVNLKEKDITLSFIMDTFGEFNGKRKYNPYDIITIPPGSYGPSPNKKNKNSFTTTIGIFIYNKFFFENELFYLIPYINHTIDDDTISSINKKLSYALAEDRLTLPVLKNYLNKTQKVMPYVSILSPNYTDKMITCSDAIDKKRQELFTKYAKEIEAGDEIVCDKITTELLNYAKEYMKDDPSMDIYLSGARGSVNNHFKNIFVTRGLIKDPDPNAKQKYKFAKSNYIDGIKPEEYALFANSLASGPYQRSKKTADGGYWEKLFVYALQHVKLDPPGSDCHTKDTVEVHLDKSNLSFWMYSFFLENGKLVELNSTNMDKYIGKTLHFRFSSLCESKTGICNKCAGNLFYRIGIENIGITLSKIPSTFKNIFMKAFHDSTQKYSDIPLDKIFNDWQDFK